MYRLCHLFFLGSYERRHLLFSSLNFGYTFNPQIYLFRASIIWAPCSGEISLLATLSLIALTSSLVLEGAFTSIGRGPSRVSLTTRAPTSYIFEATGRTAHEMTWTAN